MGPLVEVTAYSLALRYVGVAEFKGPKHHPLIQWWLSLCGLDPDSPDEIAWCSAFAQGPTWELRLPRSKSAAARSWLTVGTPITLEDAEPEYDVVVFKRGPGRGQEGPDTLDAPGHVGFYAGLEGSGPKRVVLVLGGNQGDAVSIARHPAKDVLGVRRLVA